MIESETYTIEIKDIYNKHYIVQIVWKNLEVEFTIFDKFTIWIGKLTEEESKEFSTILDLTLTDYLSTVKSSFTDTDRHDFSYEVDSEEFSWSKVENELSITYGKIKIQQLPSTDVVENVIKPLILSKKSLLEELERVKTNERRLKEELESLLKRTEECIEAKSEMEEILMNKFLCLLNEKKEYINKVTKREGSVSSRSDTNKMSSDEEMEFDHPGPSRNQF